MHYEVRIQSVVNYYYEHKKLKLVKEAARAKTLTREEYMQVPPRWVINEGVCWEKMVDRWCTDEWKAKHEERQLQRANMIRIPHHQGNRNLRSYGNAVSERLRQPVSEYKAYALSRKAKASVVAPYNDSDPAGAYTSLTSYANMQQYKEVFKETHGADSDPTIQALDPEVVMVAGGGKKHGRFMMGAASSPRHPFPLSLRSRLDRRGQVLLYVLAPLLYSLRSRVIVLQMVFPLRYPLVLRTLQKAAHRMILDLQPQATTTHLVLLRSSEILLCFIIPKNENHIPFHAEQPNMTLRCRSRRSKCTLMLMCWFSARPSRPCLLMCWSHVR